MPACDGIRDDRHIVVKEKFQMRDGAEPLRETKNFGHVR